MARIRPEQIPKTLQFLKEDLPNLLLTVGKIEDTDDYWKEVINECDAVYQRHGNEFAKDMLIAFAGYLDKQSRKKEK